MSKQAMNQKTRSASGVQLAGWPTWLFFVGLGVIFFAERVLSSEGLRRGGDLLGFAVMFGMLLTLGLRARTAKDRDEQTAYRWLTLGGGLVLLGAGIYLLSAASAPVIVERISGVFGKRVDSTRDLASTLWPALVLIGGLPMAFIQRSLSTMTDDAGSAAQVEIVRVRFSAQSALTISLVVLFCTALNYVGSDRNKKWDLARFRSTRASEATKKIVANLNKPIKATLFFPNPNEVRELLVPYFEELSASGQRFSVELSDHALEPTKARELGASGNGMVVMGVVDEKGQSTLRETLNVGMTLEASQSALSALDGDVQKKLLALSRPGRVVYFTAGHGERGFDSGGFFETQKEDLRTPVGHLRSSLQNLSYEIRMLTLGQGLSQKVPGDAGLVVVAGPTEHFLPEEVTALTTYLSDGGHVLLLLDPAGESANKDLTPVLKLVGAKFNAGILANDEVYAARTKRESDKTNTVSTSFSSHASVTTLSRAAGRAAVFLPRSGSFERDGSPPPGIAMEFTLRSMPKTYVDKNANFARDADEPQNVFDLALAASKLVAESPGPGKPKKELRLTAVGSVDAMADLALPNRANLVLALDSIKWLMQEEALVGEVAQETDAPIFHTKDQDKIWFYSTIVAAPALVLLVGLWIVRRGRQRRAR